MICIQLKQNKYCKKFSISKIVCNLGKGDDKTNSSWINDTNEYGSKRRSVISHFLPELYKIAAYRKQINTLEVSIPVVSKVISLHFENFHIFHFEASLQIAVNFTGKN